MADIVVKAAYGSVVEDDEEGFLFIGFAEGEDADEPYVLFRQPLTGGPIWFEVGDESLGAEDAVQKVARTADGLEIFIASDAVAKVGWARLISVHIGPACENTEETLAALEDLIGGWAAPRS